MLFTATGHDSYSIADASFLLARQLRPRETSEAFPYSARDRDANPLLGFAAATKLAAGGRRTSFSIHPATVAIGREEPNGVSA